MIRQRRHPAATQRTTRLEAFTDGVFAIAATLLVLDLTQHSLGEAESDAAMWQALGGMSELFVNFVLSFVLLCLMWMVHVQQFEHIARVDATMVWLNNARLLFIVLVPFATNLTTEYSEWLAGRLAMPVAFFLAILFSWLQWAWAVRRRDIMLPDMSRADAVAYGRGSLSALLISAAVVLLAPWVGSAAFLLFFFDGLLTRALRGKGG
ncbi:TMEM175 family protein [Microbacterium sp. M3]|uniref:TMEM175 family protein n=1 Tax=Microbacterium arthrosphaerae TaxID=792652 RepID=A0ABU4H3Q4_9MICO|nr:MULTISPECIES: TMEM175 family protein [Microbacterium]MDW4573958.1 TMEM175 family protein [Microbacterium arthrosphaerae]MDW7607813.1 TMEM175 family protein [Microbacterium sp. M3]